MTERDLIDRYGLRDKHCDSCHDNDEMHEVEFAGETVLVCCDILVQVRKLLGRDSSFYSECS